MTVVCAVLPDGTPSYAPIGAVVRDGQRVMCHLCGRWFRSVLAHLRVHGWDHRTYRRAFGLQRGEPLEGTDTRELRAKAMTIRRAHDPAVRAGSEVGREWVRSGALARAAADAARGRRQPEQRRRKTLAALAAVPPEVRSAGSRRHAAEHLRRTAHEAATRLGFVDIAALVRARVADGASLAAISREAGLHRNWLSRHLAAVAPQVSTVDQMRRDARWLPVVRALGFPDVATYLIDRHVRGHRTVRAIALETGLPRPAVESAFDRHGITRRPHVAARARVEERARAVASRHGFATLDEYVTDRRGAGLSWRAIAAECGEPATWLRRRAGLG